MFVNTFESGRCTERLLCSPAWATRKCSHRDNPEKNIIFVRIKQNTTIMIYVASSWRNPYYEDVVKRLRKEGLPVYDFRNPPHGGTGFHWTDVDENAPNWTFEQYAEGLRHPLAERQFEADLEALKTSDTCVCNKQIYFRHFFAKLFRHFSHCFCDSFVLVYT